MRKDWLTIVTNTMPGDLRVNPRTGSKHVDATTVMHSVESEVGGKPTAKQYTCLLIGLGGLTFNQKNVGSSPIRCTKLLWVLAVDGFMSHIG